MLRRLVRHFVAYCLNVPASLSDAILTAPIWKQTA
jgi:hypothetical protein